MSDSENRGKSRDTAEGMKLAFTQLPSNESMAQITGLTVPLVDSRAASVYYKIDLKAILESYWFQIRALGPLGREQMEAVGSQETVSGLPHLQTQRQRN